MTISPKASLWLPVIVYAAIIFTISAQAQPPLPDRLSDKQGHSVGYMGFAVTISRAVAGGLGRPLGSGGLAVTWALAAAYGATDEWHQSFVPGRSADIRDWYADAFGAGIGAFACWAWGIIRFRTDV